MTIRVTCTNPKCAKALQVKDQYAGQHANCPLCQHPITIPSPGPASRIGKVPSAPSRQSRMAAAPKGHERKPARKGLALLWRIGTCKPVLMLLLLAACTAAGWQFLQAEDFRKRLADSEKTTQQGGTTAEERRKQQSASDQNAQTAEMMAAGLKQRLTDLAQSLQEEEAKIQEQTRLFAEADSKAREAAATLARLHGACSCTPMTRSRSGPSIGMP